MIIKPPTDWTQFPLHVAVLSGNAPAAERLISAGADVNASAPGAGTPLHVAAGLPFGANAEALTRLLLDAGAKVDAIGPQGKTALHNAAESGNAEIAEILLRWGAAADARDTWHCTPLHRATASGRINVVTLLIAQGADVNAVADYTPHLMTASRAPLAGMTPLHVAIYEGHFETAETLLKSGARIDVRVAANQEGLTDLTPADLIAMRIDAMRSANEQFLASADRLLSMLSGTAIG